MPFIFPLHGTASKVDLYKSIACQVKTWKGIIELPTENEASEHKTSEPPTRKTEILIQKEKHNILNPKSTYAAATHAKNNLFSVMGYHVIWIIRDGKGHYC